MRVAFVDLESRFINITNQYLMPRHGILEVATAARRAGHEVHAYIEPLNGLPLDRILDHEVVGAAVTGSNLSRVRELFTEIRRRKPSIKLLAGGPHATLIPTDVAAIGVDVIVRDEGEAAIVEVLDALAGKRSLDDVAGISIPRDGRVVHHPRREFARSPGIVCDLSLLEGFRRKSSLMQMLRHGKMYCGYATTSRGCPFPCNFCYENMIGGTGFRRQPHQLFLDDVRRKRDFFGVNHIWLADSNFTTNPQHCVEVLDAIIDAKLGVEFSALCRTEVGRRPEVLERMRRAGFTILVIGMEATRNDRLDSMEKRQSVDDIIHCIKEVHRHGMRVIGLFMTGFDDDDAQSADRIVDFCIEHEVDAMSIYCLTEYPSLPGRTLPRHRVIETDLDYYNGHFVTTFPRRVRPSVLEKKVMDALERFFSPRVIARALLSGDLRETATDLGHYIWIRKMQKLSRAHQEKLRRLEAPYYDANDVLREDELRKRPIVGPLPPDVIADWKDPDSLVQIAI